MKIINDIDYKILQYFNSVTTSTIESAKREFPKIIGMETRLEAMVNLRWLEHEYQKIKDGSLTRIQRTSTIRITEAGRKAWQDYRHTTHKDRRELWLKNAWIPIIVSFATTVLTNYILPKLPAMIEWFRHILSRIFS